MKIMADTRTNIRKFKIRTILLYIYIFILYVFGRNCVQIFDINDGNYENDLFLGKLLNKWK